MHKISFQNWSLFYGSKQVLFDINLEIPKDKITAIIGPSGCGKSSLLRCINRMNDLYADVLHKGSLLLDGSSIYDKKLDVVDLRRKVGMVFQRSNPFPKTIYQNVAYGLQINGMRDKDKIAAIVETSLHKASLWDEVKDRLHTSALKLSGGQQQRLCIARAIALEPEVILLDEPCSALDPIATFHIEELLTQLRNKYTIVLVTHNMHQASRVSDYTVFMYMGKLVEFGETQKIFTNPKETLTENYITGRFG